MSRKHYAGIIIITAICALIGSTVSSWIFSTNTAYAAIPSQSEDIQANVVTARQFKLVDENGNKRGSWQIGPKKEVLLELCQKKGDPSIGLRVSSSGTSNQIWINNSKGEYQVQLGAEEDWGEYCTDIGLLWLNSYKGRLPDAKDYLLEVIFPRNCGHPNRSV
jgi:hypothetical protein